MLEVKHLFKEYKTKKGVTTKALDDVSLVFPEKGMVFILGKSGSGKSTLLNVCGGLDRADSGEIIIKGKSSKDFSGQDFDSYRNTYVGFVFQEYNILDEFSVEENIALALELQNKKRDRAVIDKILDDVDLAQFASRKPNTLSGGQKQRVAIARALVKEPEIIMADEPTGALDSKTGQQVFDTLKKLSKDKLVLVISHDRDFAEQYADRIIELKDGKILSDMTRSDDPELNKNLQFFGTDTVCIKNGANITDDELKKIASFLSKSGGTAIISTSREKINDFKQDRPEMDVGEFQNIKEQPVSKQYEPQKLIRSHLPLRHAVKVGAGGLKTKPVRLVFTILLSIMAFVMFGLMSTVMLFNERNVTAETLASSNYTHLALGKQYKVTTKMYRDGVLDHQYDSYRDTKFTEADLAELGNKYGDVIAVYSAGGSYYNTISFENISISSNAKQFYTDESDGFILATDKLAKAYGEYPKAADEIMLSSYHLDALKLETTQFVNESGDKITVNSETDVIWSAAKPRYLMLRMNGKSVKFKIVGIYASPQVPDDYSELKRAAETGVAFNGSYNVTYKWGEERGSGLYTYVAVSQGFIDANKDSFANSDGDPYTRYFKYSNGSIEIGADGNSFISTSSNELAPYKETPGLTLMDLYGPDGTKLTSLGSAQFAVSHSQIAYALKDKLRVYYYGQDYRDLLDAAENAAVDAYKEANGERPEDAWGSAEQQAWQSWENGMYSAVEEALRQYVVVNGGPDIDDYVGDESRYLQDLNSWLDKWLYSDEDAEEHQKEYNETVPAEAEAEYLASHPEPFYAPKAWDKGLEAAVEQARSEADPFGGKAEEFLNELDRIAFWHDDMGEKPTDEYIRDIIKTAYTMYLDCGMTIGTIRIFGSANNSERNATLAGYYINYHATGIYLSDDLYDEFYQSESNSWYEENVTKYVEPEDAIISRIFVPYDRSKTLTESLLDLSEKQNEDDSHVAIVNPLMESLDMAFGMMEMLGQVFLYAGIMLAVFSFLLMFNFISASITAKKKEIGILRAIGARAIDVFKIFFSEALIIAFICIVLAMVGTFGMCILINNVIIDAMSIALFVFTPLTAAIIIGIAIVTAFVSTILPVARYSRKPPVESIRAL